MKANKQIKTTGCSSAVDAFLKTFNEMLATNNALYPKLNNIKKRKRTIKPDVR